MAQCGYNALLICGLIGIAAVVERGGPKASSLYIGSNNEAILRPVMASENIIIPNRSEIIAAAAIHDVGDYFRRLDRLYRHLRKVHLPGSHHQIAVGRVKFVRLWDLIRINSKKYGRVNMKGGGFAGIFKNNGDGRVSIGVSNIDIIRIYPGSLIGDKILMHLGQLVSHNGKLLIRSISLTLVGEHLKEIDNNGTKRPNYTRNFKSDFPPLGGIFLFLPGVCVAYWAWINLREKGKTSGGIWCAFWTGLALCVGGFVLICLGLSQPP